MHTAYQICSQEKGDAALSELQDEKDKRIVEVRKESPVRCDAVQGDRSGCSLGFVDIKTMVAF